MSRVEFQQYIKCMPELNCLLGKYMTKTTYLKNIMLVCLDRNMSYAMYPILIRNVEMIKKVVNDEDVPRPQFEFVIPTVKKFKKIPVIDI